MPYIRTIAIRTAGRKISVRFSRPSVLAGGVVLTIIAGYVNVVMLGYFHVPVSHMTGAVSRLGIDLANRYWMDLWMILGIVGGFLGGAVLSGLVIGNSRLRPGRRYGAALVLEAVLLAVAAVLLRMHQPWKGLSLAAMGCGVQNAMASSYYGLVLRTTHMTGIVTDLGVMMGHWLRYRRIERWKLGVLVGLLLGFSAGSLAGAWAVLHLTDLALWPAVVCCGAGGGIYLLWHRRTRVLQRLRARQTRKRAVRANRILQETVEKN